MATSSGFRISEEFSLFRSVSVRTGIYSGLCLSIGFAFWLFAASRFPLLEPFAPERNAAALALLLLFAAIPVMRFYRMPFDLLLSGLLAWALLSSTYALLSTHFVRLDEFFEAFHIFMLGAVVYLLLATLSWIGTIVWRTRASTHASHASQSQR